MRVLIISNQPLWRDALAALIRAEIPDSEVTILAGLAELDDAEAAGLCLLDLPAHIDSRSWISEAADRLAGRLKILTVPERDLTLARVAHASGFKGVIAKTYDAPLIAAALRLVLAGGQFFPCFECGFPPSVERARPSLDVLTPRQRAVFAELELGRTNKEIAKRLGVSIATVKLEVQSILAATGARNRTEAVSRLTRAAL